MDRSHDSMSKGQAAGLVVGRDAYDAMLLAARKAAPLEACGLLGGSDGCVAAYYELKNADASGEHYSMLPEEQFAAIKDMRARGIGLIGIWHSHPETPARMSEEDIRLAYQPDIAYVIISLAGADPQLRGFEMADGIPNEIAIEVTDDVNEDEAV